MSSFNVVDASRIKFEARVQPPPEEPRKGSRFGRFLRGLGLLGAPVGYAASLFFPPAALIGAAAYGIGQVGGHRDQSRRRDQTPQAAPTVFFPGVTTPAGGPDLAPTAGAVGDPLNVIADRQAATNEMVGQVR